MSERDVDLDRRLQHLAERLDAAAPAPDGVAVRRAARPATTVGADRSSRRAVSRRGYVLALAAAAGIVIVGALAVAGGAGDPDRTLVGPATDSADEPLTHGEQTVADPEAGAPARSGKDSDDRSDEEDAEGAGEPDAKPVDEDGDQEMTETGQPEALVDAMPIPVPPDEVGPIEGRRLPDTALGYRLVSAAQVLLSDHDPEGETIDPVSMVRTWIPAADTSDRRSISVVASTFASKADADAAVRAEPTPRGQEGEPIEIDGMVGAYTTEEAFQPMTDGSDRQDLLAIRIRYDEVTVLDVAAVDTPLAELTALVVGAEADDGGLEFPIVPTGFGSARSYTHPSVWALADEHGTDVLSLGFFGPDGSARYSIEIVAVDGLLDDSRVDEAEADVVTEQGVGFVVPGLFRELGMVWIGPDFAAHVVRSGGDGPDSDAGRIDELMALSSSLHPVTAADWTAAMVGIQGFHVPVTS